MEVGPRQGTNAPSRSLVKFDLSGLSAETFRMVTLDVTDTVREWASGALAYRVRELEAEAAPHRRAAD